MSISNNQDERFSGKMVLGENQVEVGRTRRK